MDESPDSPSNGNADIFGDMHQEGAGRLAFADVVRAALEALPEEFRHALENVAVVVEDEPSAADLESVDLDPEEDELFGLYHGTPLTERGHEHSGLPDRVVVYRGPLTRCFGDLAELKEEIRKTVIHELGHHMGLSDKEMPY